MIFVVAWPGKSALVTKGGIKLRMTSMVLNYYVFDVVAMQGLVLLLKVQHLTNEILYFSIYFYAQTYACCLHVRGEVKLLLISD